MHGWCRSRGHFWLAPPLAPLSAFPLGTSPTLRYLLSPSSGNCHALLATLQVTISQQQFQGQQRDHSIKRRRWCMHLLYDSSSTVHPLPAAAISAMDAPDCQSQLCIQLALSAPALSGNGQAHFMSVLQCDGPGHGTQGLSRASGRVIGSMSSPAVSLLPAGHPPHSADVKPTPTLTPASIRRSQVHIPHLSSQVANSSSKMSQQAFRFPTSINMSLLVLVIVCCKEGGVPREHQ